MQVYPFAAATKSMPELGLGAGSTADGGGAATPAAAVAAVAAEDAAGDSVPVTELTLASVSEQIQSLLDEVGAKAMEGKERKKSTLKNVLSQRRSGVSDFG